MQSTVLGKNNNIIPISIAVLLLITFLANHLWNIKKFNLLSEALFTSHRVDCYEFSRKQFTETIPFYLCAFAFVVAKINQPKQENTKHETRDFLTGFRPNESATLNVDKWKYLWVIHHHCTHTHTHIHTPNSISIHTHCYNRAQRTRNKATNRQTSERLTMASSQYKINWVIPSEGNTTEQWKTMFIFEKKTKVEQKGTVENAIEWRQDNSK